MWKIKALACLFALSWIWLSSFALSPPARAEKLTIRVHDAPDLTPIIERLDAVEGRLEALEQQAQPAPAPGPVVPPPSPVPPVPQPAPPDATLAEHIARMVPGVWYQIPGTNLRPHLTSQGELDNIGGPLRSVQGPWAVIHVWCGAAFSGANWYFGPCGGHNSYNGNEVYRFSFEALSWSRLYPPRPVTRVGTSNNGRPDCGPSAWHNYDGVIWAPKDRAFWMWAKNAPGSNAWRFSPEVLAATGDVCQAWTKGLESPLGGERYYKTALLPDGRIALIGGGATQAVAFDPVTQTYGPRSRTTPWLNYTAADSIGWKVYILHKAKTRGYADVWVVDFSGDRPSVAARIEGSTTPIPWKAIDAGFVAANGRLVSTEGWRDVLIYDPATNAWRHFPNPTGPAPTPQKGISPVYSKFIYLASFEAFALYNNVDEGVWLYRLPDAPQVAPHKTAGLLRVCPPENFTAGCDYQSIRAAAQAATDGDTIQVAPGEYGPFVINADNITVKAQGAVVSGAREGKGAVIVNGDNLTVIGLECRDVTVPDHNGACFRQQAKNLTLRKVYLHDMEMGVLSSRGSGFLIFEDSLLERCGGPSKNPHCIYAAGNDLVIVRRTTLRCNVGSGHLLKSRAAKTVVEDSILDGRGTGCRGSREIDIADGGEVILRRNTIIKGEGSEQQNSFCYGCGWARPGGQYHDVSPPPLLDQNRWATCRAKKTVWFQAFKADGTSFQITAPTDTFTEICPGAGAR